MYSQFPPITYQSSMAVATPGQIKGMGQYRGVPCLNAAGGASGVYTITPPATVDASTNYSVLIDGLLTTVTSGGSTTTLQLGTLIYNALRSNPLIYRKADITINGSGVVTLTARLVNTAIAITSPSNASTTNDLVIATSTAPGTANAVVPFGRFVGRRAAYGYDPTNLNIAIASLIDSTSLYTATGAEVIGVTMEAFLERSGVGSAAVAGYPWLSVMNVLDRCNAIEGIWVECVEPDIIPSDGVYIAVGAGNEGKATKTSSGTVDVTAKAKFISTVQQVQGRNIVAVYWNRY